MRPRLQLLDADAVHRVHAGALAILERVGVRLAAPLAEKLVLDAGQRLDPVTRIARLAPDLVERCLALVPRTVLLAARQPGRDVTLGHGRVHACLDGQATFVMDGPAGTRRSATLQDLVEVTRLSDGLESVDVYWAPVVAGDVAPQGRTLAEAAAGFRHTTRHVQHEVKTPAHVPYLLEMLDALLGDRRRHRERPIFSLTVCPVSPLQHEAKMTAACLEMARHYVPICFLPMPLAGGTAPVTLMGTVVQTVAEFLGGVVLYQLAQPGCPMIFGIGSTVLDMRTGLYAAGAPELPLLNLALTEMAHHYGVPAMAQGVVTDAKAPGPQAAAEKMASALVAALAGADIVNGLGLLDSHQALSLEQLVLDDELFRGVRRIADGFETGDDHVLLELVEAVGCGGNFLGQRRTLEFLRRGEHFEPRLGQRGSHDAWLRRGKSELEAARERAAGILRDHEPVPLPRDVDAALAGIVAHAQATVTAG
ncbi:MAG TPA: trimethylamine methyltransferase family protein [Vicinamibacteria bacterium]|nr:trimethylamine methyltransferase family protein [Vicinamibacteria bacterium]